MRLSFPHERHDAFPKVADAAFLGALRGQTPSERVAVRPCGQRNHDMDEASLQTLAANNPVASMLAFHQMIENVREHLLCLSGERAWNQPMPSTFVDDMPEDAREQPREKGIYGVCTSNRDVKETNKRAAMHEHGHLHGGASPALLADVVSDDRLRREVLEAIDTHVCGELPLEKHAVKEMMEELMVATRRDAACDIPLPPMDIDEFVDFGGKDQGELSNDEFKKQCEAEHREWHDSTWTVPLPLTFKEDCNHTGKMEQDKETYKEWKRGREELLRESGWYDELLHHAHTVVMSRHTHEHQAACASAGKEGKGKGKYMCRCSPRAPRARTLAEPPCCMLTSADSLAQIWCSVGARRRGNALRGAARVCAQRRR